MNLSNYISELLESHHCVVVPGLGGFISAYQPSKMMATRHLHLPPSKAIVFNVNLQANDGLLVSHVAFTEQLSFDEAMKLIVFYVDQLREELRERGKVELQKIGELTMTSEEKILFEPSNTKNHLIDAFGFTPVQAVPVRREGRVERMATVHNIAAKRLKRKVWYYAAASVILAALIGGGYYFVNTGKVNYSSASFNFFDSMMKEEKKVQLLPLAENKQVKEGLIDKSAPATTTTYYIIGGSFSARENADKFVGKMEQSGIRASLLEDANSGRFRVSIGQFSTKDEAKASLDGIKKRVSKDAWILSM